MCQQLCANLRAPSSARFTRVETFLSRLLLKLQQRISCLFFNVDSEALRPVETEFFLEGQIGREIVVFGSIFSMFLFQLILLLFLKGWTHIISLEM